MADYSKLAKDIVEHVGGEENVNSLTHCITRLRFKLKDESKADTETLTNMQGVIKVMQAAGQYQVVIGSEVEDVYDQILLSTKIGDKNKSETVETDHSSSSNKKSSVVEKITDLISGIFMPFMGAFAGAGLLKGFLVLFTTLSLLDKTSTTYTILYAASDSIFYFLPVFLAYCAGQKFGAKPFISMAIACAMCYPSLTGLFNDKEIAVTFLSIPVKLISYPSSVLPILITVYAQSKLEKGLMKVIPKIIQSMIIPLLDFIVVFPLALIVIGPVTDVVSKGLAGGIQMAFSFSPAIAGFALGTFWPLCIVFGLHWGFFPIVMNNYSVLGYDYIMPPTFGANFGIAAACLAVFLKTRNKDLKLISGSASISALIGGVTEPGIYGVLLKNKRIFIGMCLINGISGIIAAVAGSIRTTQVPVNVLTIPALYAMSGPAIVISMAFSFVGVFLVTYFFTYKNDAQPNKA
ncbi:PTS transporter subunit EIIC [Lacrimispora sp.]|uniref:PTS transporter subunit EIIC n=1 Tax=Lacrimispora sp. TaxID=2719234 RepID=UPI0028B0CCF0|nr:PTS transporter subunit EIIC [Lacrimispora sp.]